MKENKMKESQKLVQENLKKCSNLSVDELFKKYKTSYKGLSIVEIDDRIEEYGKNTIEVKKHSTLFYKLKGAFINPFNMVLILVAIITYEKFIL